MSLKPWREVIIPHKDVLEGTYQEAEFAADLTKVVSGVASPEYSDPALFFERTFITEGTRLLLDSVIRRLSGKGGDPVIQLKTAFGGGKTHTMLAVHHLVTAKNKPSELPGVPQVLASAGTKDLPRANIAVIDGNAMSASHPRVHEGVKVNTMWGEIAWQLGGKDGYDMVAQSDKDGTSPGKDRLFKLFETYAPCVILLDEAVAYIRQFEDGKSYNGGTFASHASFVQALTESASSPRTVILASLPESNMELGGTQGRKALEMLEKYFGRVESIWKPVATEEGFEIVRRRLFGKVQDERAKDEVCQGFATMYVQGQGNFPPETVESSYLDRLRSSYPIHPEIFDRLYGDWATLEKFQRTRGVLRLMAMTIHRLWSDGNKDLMIMPGGVPIGDSLIGNELIRYLPQGWEPVIEQDIDGLKARTTRLDEKNPMLGSVQAARRVARTIFLGSAPSVVEIRQKSVRGISEQGVFVGCVQPGQPLGRYADAIKHMSSELHYLYSASDRSTNQTRYWYDTRPNLHREMQERMQRYKEEDVISEMRERMRSILGNTMFSGVHIFTPAGDIPDDLNLRLVVLPPMHAHKGRGNGTDAKKLALAINSQRGQQPRQYQNRLVFLASDMEYVSRATEFTKRYLAWKSIVDDRLALNLDQFRITEAQRSLEDASGKLDGVLKEAYRWILAPAQDPKKKGGLTEVYWEEKPINAGFGKKMGEAIQGVLVENEIVINKWSPVHLKDILSTWFWKDGQQDIVLSDLWKNFCRYLYLPRLLDVNVLVNTVAEGTKDTDFFGFAKGKEGDRYLGLIFGRIGTVYEDGVVVEASIAAAQIASEEERKKAPATVTVSSAVGATPAPPDSTSSVKPTAAPLPTTSPEKGYKRFHGRVRLDALKVGSQSSKIAEEVVQHLSGQLGVKVEVYLEINAFSEQGVRGSAVNIVKENAKTLKFEICDFEED